MHIPRKPGDQIEVDWAGDPACVVDRDTGEIIPAYIFVGVLSYSLYAYVEAFFLRTWTVGLPPMSTCTSSLVG